jgi:phosphonatase-like hydrolase
MDGSVRIELVVFGVEGTTIRPAGVGNECMRKALIAANVPATREAVAEVTGIPKPVAIRRLIAKFIGSEQATDERVSEIHADFLHRATDQYRRGAGVEPTPHAEETLVRLKHAGVRVALAAPFGRVVLDALLERLRWRSTGLIDATVSADEVGRGRPYPDLVMKAMSLCGVRRTDAVASVGDTPIDLEMGAGAGCGLVVGLMNGSHTTQQLRHAPHTHLISHLGVLPRLVIGHGLISAGPVESQTEKRGLNESAALRGL